MARTTTATLRLAPAELAAWRAAAQAEGASLSDWLRGRIGAARPRKEGARRGGADPDLLAALARIGANVNQLARAANSGRSLPTLAALAAIERELKGLRP